MKLNTQAFPYPVLTNEEGAAADYKDSAFQCSLLFNSEISENNTLDVEYVFNLSNDDIQNLIDKGDAAFALDMYCSDTLNRQLHSLGPLGRLSIDATELYGKVEFTPVIVVKNEDVRFSSSDLNDEFDGTEFVLNYGDIVAVDDTWTKYIEYNSLSFDTLVKVRTDESLSPFDYTIEPSPSFIYVNMGVKMRDLWREMSQSKVYKATIAMSVYKDLVFLAIEELIDNPDAEGQQWARALRAKIGKIGYHLPEEREFNAINTIAQKLVGDAGAHRLARELGVE